MDVLATIRDILRDRLNLPAERVVPEASLKSLGIDSLMLLELIFECEEKLNRKIEHDTATPTTVGELMRIVEQFADGQSPA